MRVLHLVKTSDGAQWAALQVRELVRLGVGVHVVLPSPDGARIDDWRLAGAELHFLDLDLRPGASASLASRAGKLRRLVKRMGPDVIHSHFLSTTLMARLALGRTHPVPRLFQVPGPLHLEHALFRAADLRTAGPRDAWIASSRYIEGLYVRAGVPRDRRYMSYYGSRMLGSTSDGGAEWRRAIGVPPGARVVGNISFIYPPKRVLGQTEGLKGHRRLLEVLDLVCRQQRDVWGVLAGGTFAGSRTYEHALRRRAAKLGGGRILMPGPLPAPQVADAWRAFDCAVHLPLSENCGGVVEPLAAEVPIVAAAVGGIPEVVIDRMTGRLVKSRKAHEVAKVIGEVLEEVTAHRRMAARGAGLVRTMFDVERTAMEIRDVYAHIVESGRSRPSEFDPAEYLADVGAS